MVDVEMWNTTSSNSLYHLTHQRTHPFRQQASSLSHRFVKLHACKVQDQRSQAGMQVTGVFGNGIGLNELCVCVCSLCTSQGRLAIMDFS